MRACWWELYVSAYLCRSVHNNKMIISPMVFLKNCLHALCRKSWRRRLQKTSFWKRLAFYCLAVRRTSLDAAKLLKLSKHGACHRPRSETAWNAYVHHTTEEKGILNWIQYCGKTIVLSIPPYYQLSLASLNTGAVTSLLSAISYLLTREKNFVFVQGLLPWFQAIFWQLIWSDKPLKVNILIKVCSNPQWFSWSNSNNMTYMSFLSSVSHAGVTLG